MRIGVGVFSANKDVGVTRDAIALAVDILMKPMTASVLVQGIEKALARNRASHKA